MKINSLKIPILIGILSPFWFSAHAQDAQNLIHQGNQKLVEKSYTKAEFKFRKAISESPQQMEGVYNLGNVHYRSEDYQEASQRFLQTQKLATSNEKRHKAFHNLGNALMKKKDYPQAVEAYKNALRNNPKDDETRYNYALAKSLLEQERQQNDPSEQNQENQEDDQSDQNDQNENQSEEDSSDENQDDGQSQPDNQSGQDQEQQDQNPQPQQQNRLSPQQIKNLLQAMDNQEKNVQEKINAQRVRGTSQSARKDW
ncbi:MAG: tetratricopeptide repeat protein [Flavobacteriaceae bacterium]|nr:tetratricopeptide repeat protein [Flavobacteriaceae bacterium]MCY4215408.1 tetratricopeptide repeat protein [Flavobacteriaceae bacterium]